MGPAPSAPWHKASFDRLVDDSLPELLAARLPLSGYRVEPDGNFACRVSVAIAAAAGDIEVHYSIPQPDDEGLFEIDGRPHVVVPVASSEHLDTAQIRCVGEQLYDYIESRLGEPPSNLTWDEQVLGTWFPLDTWTREFLDARAQQLDATNWLASRTHMRRIVVPDRREVIAPGQFGRVCPFEIPEGPNIGGVFSVAVGAEIRDGRLVIADDRPEAALGLTASTVPFLEHNDPNRQTFGANMMRQWMVPPDPEPAYVQTGSEPGAPGFWCGRNLLTAFVSWSEDTYEDGILISQSCARRLGYPRPVEPGDKLSNRHGTKGVVSRIVPDDEMPHLSDGTPVELVFSFIGIHTRLNFGQVREAVMSRLARAEGAPVRVPPFRSPSESEIRNRLEKAGLPEDGMGILTRGRGGAPLEQPSLVGWVYWGKTNQTVEGKFLASLDGSNGMRQGELEYYALRDAGAFENLMEQFNTRAADRPEAKHLPARIVEGAVAQAGPPTPRFAELRSRLLAAGIEAGLEDGKLSFRFADPPGPVLELAESIPHPWLPEHGIDSIGAVDGIPGLDELVRANDRLRRMLASRAPESLVRKSRAELQDRARRFFAALLGSGATRFSDALDLASPRYGGRVAFSGKTVLAPARDLHLDQVGLPEEMAWAFFGPFAERELGAEKVARRTERAVRALDEIMEGSWVLINRAPTFMPTCILAFHPVRSADRVLRLHPLACMLMNADFDGDQAAVFVPVTEGAQREAGEKLSVAGHLQREPELIRWLCPAHEMLWGLARLSLTKEGQEEISQIVELPVAAPEGFVTRESLTSALRSVLEQEGAERAIAIAEQLMRRGLDVTQQSGASMSPFIGMTAKAPPEPATDDPEAWKEHMEIVSDLVAAGTDFESIDIGPQLLSVKSGARGSMRHLAFLLGPQGAAVDASGATVIVRHGYRDGLAPEEVYAIVPRAREGLGQLALESMRMGYGVREAAQSKAFTVLARAMRSANPGPVFARAAASGEVDPLADLDSRLFVGLEATAK